VSVKLLEKQLSLTSNYHFGPQEGWNKQLVWTDIHKLIAAFLNDMTAKEC
jgi:hypothetical protein